MVAPPVAPREAPRLPLVDTHAHLNDRRFMADVDAVVARARAAGVGAMVVVGYDLPTSRRAVALAQQYPCLWATVGLHPHYASACSPSILSELAALAQEPRVVAIGECGLDYYRNLSPRSQQVQAFEAQLSLANRLGLPVVVHSRQAMSETLQTLSRTPPAAGGVLHCFDGALRDAEQAMDLGLFISCAGNITYRPGPELIRALESVPAGRVVIETDCPWLSPQGHRGERNEPAHLALVAQALAQIRRVDARALAAQTSENAARLFRTPEIATLAYAVAGATEVAL
jgi:TatD DNase family protein